VLAGLAVAIVVVALLRKRSGANVVQVLTEEGSGGPGVRLRWQTCFALALGWGAFPVLVMVASGLTKRGLFVDRYFAPSVIGMVLISALLGSALWRRFATKSAAENRNGGSVSRGGTSAVSAVVLMTLIVLAGLRVFRANAAWAPGRERLATEINALRDVKVSEDEHAYFHALYYSPPGSMCLLICNDGAARDRWRKFSDEVRTTSDEEFARLPSFVWLSPETRRDATDLAAWAGRHAYNFQRRSATEPDGVQAIGWRTYYEFQRR
jgi:hypothetical protein